MEINVISDVCDAAKKEMKAVKSKIEHCCNKTNEQVICTLFDEPIRKTNQKLIAKVSAIRRITHIKAITFTFFHAKKKKISLLTESKYTKLIF